MLADVVPIQAFILVYIGLATVRFFGAPWWARRARRRRLRPGERARRRAAIGAAFGPLNGSVGYLPVPILIARYAAALRRRAPEAARGLAIGAGDARGLAGLPHRSTRRSAPRSRSARTSSGTS